MKFGNCHEITDFCLAEGGVLKIKELLVDLRHLSVAKPSVFKSD